jgi:hypothetical protein
VDVLLKLVRILIILSRVQKFLEVALIKFSTPLTKKIAELVVKDF